MTTIAIRKKLHEFIDKIEEKKAKAIYTLFEEEIKQGERIIIEQYNKEIDEAEAEFEKGDYITHDAMLKKVKQW
jgi:predicted transcriptional regulator